MPERFLLARYTALLLVAVSGIEWLLGRAVSRLAASPALEGTPRSIIETLGSIGLFFLAPAFLLASTLLVLTLLDLGGAALKVRAAGVLALAFFLLFFGIFCLVHPLLQKETWSVATLNLLTLIALMWVGLEDVGRKRSSLRLRFAVLVAALGYAGYLLFVLSQEASKLGLGSGGLIWRDLGEIAAVTAPFIFFAALCCQDHQWLRLKRWIIPVMLALAFSAGNIADMLANQGFTGVMAIWSVGFSFFLPWPAYAISLALFAYTVATCLSRDIQKPEDATADRGLGLMLLLFASFELQFPYQHMLAVLSLLLLSGLARPLVDAVAATERLSDKLPLASDPRPLPGYVPRTPD